MLIGFVIELGFVIIDLICDFFLLELCLFTFILLLFVIFVLLMYGCFVFIGIFFDWCGCEGVLDWVFCILLVFIVIFFCWLEGIEGSFGDSMGL